MSQGLPKFLRDFHDQKDVFKAIWRCVERKRVHPEFRGYLERMSWVDAHVFTIDFFLWFMARHGYTLQRKRKSQREGDLDLYATIEQMKDEQMQASRAEFDDRKKEAGQ